MEILNVNYRAYRITYSANQFIRYTLWTILFPIDLGNITKTKWIREIIDWCDIKARNCVNLNWAINDKLLKNKYIFYESLCLYDSKKFIDAFSRSLFYIKQWYCRLFLYWVITFIHSENIKAKYFHVKLTFYIKTLKIKNLSNF